MFRDPDPALQLCGVAGMAGTLLHELTHVWLKVTSEDNAGAGSFGWHTWDDGDPLPPPFDAMKMAKGAFLWALSQRFDACLTYDSGFFLTTGADLPDNAYPCANPLPGSAKYCIDPYGPL